MTFRCHMVSAIASLEAALQTAEQERDKAVFQVASGVRSQLQLGRLCERVALVRSLWCHAQELLPQSPPPQGEPRDARRAQADHSNPGSQERRLQRRAC